MCPYSIQQETMLGLCGNSISLVKSKYPNMFKRYWIRPKVVVATPNSYIPNMLCHCGVRHRSKKVWDRCNPPKTEVEGMKRNWSNTESYDLEHTTKFLKGVSSKSLEGKPNRPKWLDY